MQNKLAVAGGIGMSYVLAFAAIGGGLMFMEHFQAPSLPQGSEFVPDPIPKLFRHIENRSVVDRPDDISEKKQIHAVYVIPSDGEDKGYDTSGKIATSMEIVQRWLENQTDDRRLRLDTRNGLLDVSFYRLSQTEEEMRAYKTHVVTEIGKELQAVGFNDTNKLYAVYYDGLAPFCGGAPIGGNKVAAIYHDCRDFSPSLEHSNKGDLTILHEIFHAFGAVPDCAPNRTSHTVFGSSHVSDSSSDLMYAGGTGQENRTKIVLDFGRNDYYGHGRDDCLDIAKSPFWQDSNSAG